MSQSYSLLLEPEQVVELLEQPHVKVIDLSRPETHAEGHVPGALHVLPLQTQAGTPPAPGLPPSHEQITTLYQELGLTAGHHVIAYDDEGGGWAARFLWLLDCIGHHNYSYMNGGIHSWRAAELPLETEINTCKPSETEVSQNLGQAFISLEEVLERYQNEDVVLWDARSRDEFEGIRSYTPKAGHIPGAIHYEWTQPMDMNRQLRLRDLGVLREELASMGITSDKEVITYCHSHHRSAFAWLVGKVLGFPNVRGFAGSWSQWGTHPDTPVHKEFS